MKKYADRGSQDLKPLNIGDKVVFKRKPDSHWEPAIVKDLWNKSPRSYIIETSNGNKYRRNRIHLRYDKSNENTNNNNSLEKSQQDSQSSQVINKSQNNSEMYFPRLDFAIPSTSSQVITRSGRVVKVPDRYMYN